MKTERIESLWREAQRRRLLPADAALPPLSSDRPWPVVLLTALGAWLAAVPLMVGLGLMLGSNWTEVSAGAMGLVLLVAGVLMLRSAGASLFVEQLGLPLLGAGGALLGFALYKDLSWPIVSLLLACVALVVGALMRARGLQACAGAIAAALFVATFRESAAGLFGSSFWLGCHLGLVVWVVLSLWEHVAGLPQRLQSLGTGWGLMILLSLAASSGTALLMGSVVGVWSAEALPGPGMAWVSAALALLGAAVLGTVWAPLRHFSYAAIALLLAGLAVLMPSLGAALLVAAVACTQARWRVAAVAALAALWIVGSFYYQLAWDLVTKARVLAGVGLLLALAVAPLWPRRAARSAADAMGARAARVGAALSLVAVLGAVNVGIAQKEALMGTGQAVFVALAPADPRSLMQGDFMRLNFSLPPEVSGAGSPPLTGPRPRLVAQVDVQGVATLVRVHAGEALAPGELLITLTPKNGRWTLVTDAWFFKEGEAQRWAGARFGEFRVTADGQALLVGLRGEGLRPL
ncbi:MAG: DUF4401 domain-containing protein [Burkholderiales bacterium]|nr:MAG: DUF4401 domain-containing protein [Burkholderiales bacterium]